MLPDFLKAPTRTVKIAGWTFVIVFSALALLKIVQVWNSHPITSHIIKFWGSSMGGEAGFPFTIYDFFGPTNAPAYYTTEIIYNYIFATIVAASFSAIAVFLSNFVCSTEIGQCVVRDIKELYRISKISIYTFPGVFIALLWLNGYQTWQFYRVEFGVIETAGFPYICCSLHWGYIGTRNFYLAESIYNFLFAIVFAGMAASFVAICSSKESLKVLSRISRSKPFRQRFLFCLNLFAVANIISIYTRSLPDPFNGKIWSQFLNIVTAVGFPLQAWESNSFTGDIGVHWFAVAFDVVCAVWVSTLVGCALTRYSHKKAQNPQKIFHPNS